jgi:hypothetical protein
MRVIVNSPGSKRIRIWLPSGLVFNPVAAMLLPGIMKQNGLEITREQALAMVRAINRYRRRHPDWKLVEVEGATGEYVKVTL